MQETKDTVKKEIFSRSREKLIGTGTRGNSNQGEELIVSSGLDKLEAPFFWRQAVYVYNPRAKGIKLRFMCDTESIKELTREWAPRNLSKRSHTQPDRRDREDYLSHLEKFAKKNGLAYVITKDNQTDEGIWKGANISLIKQDLFLTLPDFPEGYSVE